MPNPVRIYVLHHPDSVAARELTDDIYDWFRLPSLEGIPVYVRSVAPGNDAQPLPPESSGRTPSALEYLLPLLDAHLVRDPAWHDYLRELAANCQHGITGKARAHGWVMFPVALDASAFNLPPAITRRNFIRHGAGPRREDLTEAQQQAVDAEETLKHLTEALARDLNGRLFPKQAAARFKIFISYARADSTDVAKALRDYIQSETQCQAYLDENDIGFGQAFQENLAANVDDLARAMIAVNSDAYADRPWCRWEIGRFTKPRRVPLEAHPPRRRNTTSPREIQVFHPILVVDTIKGPHMTRVVPELAQAPVVRWDPAGPSSVSAC